MKTEVVVIGNGLFGSSIIKLLTAMGVDSVVVYDDRASSASKCSAGVWKPSWVNKKIKDKVEYGMAALEAISGGIADVSFELYSPEGEFEKEEAFKYADRDWIMKMGEGVNQVFGKVVRIEKAGKSGMWGVRMEDDSLIRTKHVILACGAAVDFLLEASDMIKLGVDAYWGVSYEYKGKPAANQISVWAPYKQVVNFSRYNGYGHLSDGTTVKNPIEDDPRLVGKDTRLLKNAEKVGWFGGGDLIQVTGLRPYLPKNLSGQFFIRNYLTNLHIATGAAKNGTILSGYVAKCAYEIVTKQDCPI